MYSDSGQLLPPNHFGYGTPNPFTADTTTKYLLVDDSGKQFYPAIYPEFKNKWRFTDSDFNRIQADPNMNYIFNNGDLEVFLST